MGIPGMNSTDNFHFEPRWVGTRELNIGNAWRAMWVDDEPIPAEAPVLYGYVVVVSDGKGYATRRAGQTAWRTVEGAAQANEKPEAFAKRVAHEQTGAATGKAVLIGYFECKATSYNPDFPVGTATVRPVYLFVATKMQEIGKESGFERRRLPINEYVRVLRAGYPELQDSLTTALDRYIVQQAKGAGSK